MTIVEQSGHHDSYTLSHSDSLEPVFINVFSCARKLVYFSILSATSVATLEYCCDIQNVLRRDLHGSFPTETQLFKCGKCGAYTRHCEFLAKIM